MTFEWRLLLEFGLISVALLFATFLRARVKFFQRFLIPNSLTAGFLLFFFYNYLAPKFGWDAASLKNMVYHFISLSFIAMILRVHPKRENKKGSNVWATATAVLSQYAIQCFVGTGITLLFIYTIMPDLFPGFGLFTTLGFSLGPGQAFGIASGWESHGFPGLGDVGLTFGAVGFILACFGGVFLINWAIGKGWIAKSKIDKINAEHVRFGVSRSKKGGRKSEVTDHTNAEAIDPLTFNLALVLSIYLLTFIILKGVSYLLSLLGTSGTMVADNLWNIIFIFAALTAMIVKAIMTSLKIEYVVDNDRLTRISGFAVDFMVAGAIAAISIKVVAEYWILILIYSGVVGLITIITHIWLSSRIFSDHAFYRSILVYGCITGTLPTGLALLRVIDPNFETPASRDYMYAAGLVFVAASPILLTANTPVMSLVNGDGLKGTWLVFAMYGLYVVACFIAYLFLSGNRRFKEPSKIWLRRKETQVM